MDIHQLELFLAVMDSPSADPGGGGVSCRRAQSACSCIAWQTTHTELFVRSGKRLIPTPAALRLAEHAKTLVELTHQIKQEFENDVAKDTRPFNFATGVTTLIYQLGKPLRQLRKQYPKAQIRVSVSVTEETVRGLHDRRFDLGLISLPVPEENLTIIPLFDEELLIVGPATNKSRRGHIGAIKPRNWSRSCSCSISSRDGFACPTDRSSRYRRHPTGCDGS
jgi:DNA-binding transcriptional LysR family regulator